MTISPITNPQVGTTLPAMSQSDFAKNMQPVADLFHMSTDDLMSQLHSGKSLADIAQAHGVSRDDLLDVVQQDIAKNAPAGTDPSQIAALANKMVDHTPSTQGHHHHHHGGSASQSTTTPSTPTQFGTSGLDVLA